MTLYTRKDTVAEECIFTGKIFNVSLNRVLNPAGREITCEVVQHHGGVVIACLPSPQEIFLIRQYRYAIDEELIELPAGRLNQGEDRLAAAKRELTEETGYEAANWSELPAMFTAPGFCTELLTAYRATDVKWVGKRPDEDEETDVFKVTLDEAWQLVLDGKVRDSKTMAVLGVVCHSR